MRFVILFIMIFWATFSSAVEPDEMLDDVVLETRARTLSAGLRCPVCQNESIDESNASLAKDLRIILRERLVAGDTDDEAVQFLVDRYGEYVLLSPNGQGINLVLWLAGPLLLLLAIFVGIKVIQTKQPPPQALSKDEQEKLDKLLKM